MGLDFTAIDFETANANAASACAVGLVKVRDGRVTERASWLIRPREPFHEFHPTNIRIHGILPDRVRDAPDWAAQLPDMLGFIGQDITVAHNAGFDMGVIAAACKATIVPTPKLRYLCSLQLARKTYELSSYRLPVAAAAAGFGEFAHHDALADSEACAAIVVDAARRFGCGSLPELARAAGIRVPTLKAVPLRPSEI